MTKAAIFDLDGTLLDSMGVWDQVDIDFLNKRGIEVPPDYMTKVSAMQFRQIRPNTPRPLRPYRHARRAHAGMGRHGQRRLFHHGRSQTRRA